MHGPVSLDEFLHHISGFVGAYFLTLAFMNAYAAYYLWTSGKAKGLFRAPIAGFEVTTAHLWLIVALAFTIIGGIALGGNVQLLTTLLTQRFRDFVDALMRPATYTGGTAVALLVIFLLRRFFV